MTASNPAIGRGLAIVLILFGLITGCGRSPFQRLDPSGTAWTVVEVTNVDLPDASVVVAFDDTGGYTITGPCRVVTGERWIDTDGEGFGFFKPTVRTTDCSDPGVDEAVIAALLAVQSWDVTDAEHITLAGQSTIKLSRSR